MSGPLPRRPCARNCGRTMVNPTGVCRSCQTAERQERDRQRLLLTIQTFERLHHRIPGAREILNGHSNGRRLFGSWNTAVRAAGFEPTDPGRNTPPPRFADRIPLTSHRGIIGWALVDPEDAERLGGQHWNLGTDGYAYGRVDGRQVAMHRVIMGLEKGDGRDVDHFNGERLDNRRCNLRICTRSENLQNRTAPATGRSRFRGVYHDSRKWVARASLQNLVVVIGRFDQELDAAVAAQRWRDDNMPFAKTDPELVAVLGNWPPLGVVA